MSSTLETAVEVRPFVSTFRKTIWATSGDA
jgi:hypothetical protein